VHDSIRIEVPLLLGRLAISIIACTSLWLAAPAMSCRLFITIRHFPPRSIPKNFSLLGVMRTLRVCCHSQTDPPLIILVTRPMIIFIRTDDIEILSWGLRGLERLVKLLPHAMAGMGIRTESNPCCRHTGRRLDVLGGAADELICTSSMVMLDSVRAAGPELGQDVYW
jgi:hypothetical protein